MPGASFHLCLIGSLAGIVALVPGGCPVEGTLSLPGAPVPPPGHYWVIQRDGQLYYFDLPEQRGQPGRWLVLPPQEALPGAGGPTPDPAWFAGMGLYELREDMTWTLIEAAASSGSAADAGASEALALDAFLQLHDPPPQP